MLCSVLANLTHKYWTSKERHARDKRSILFLVSICNNCCNIISNSNIATLTLAPWLLLQLCSFPRCLGKVQIQGIYVAVACVLLDNTAANFANVNAALVFCVKRQNFFKTKILINLHFFFNDALCK